MDLFEQTLLNLIALEQSGDDQDLIANVERIVEPYLAGSSAIPEAKRLGLAVAYRSRSPGLTLKYRILEQIEHDQPSND